MQARLRSAGCSENQRNITSSGCYKMASSTQMHCNFDHPNLDPEKCFYSRLLFQTKNVCGFELNSEWSNEIFIKNYRLVESCDSPTALGVSDFIILFSSISTLIIFIIVFIRCNIERMKNYVFPIVPDPKNSFHNLFDNHNGYFQEWVKTTMTDTHQEIVECITDEQNDQPLLTYVKENEVVMPVNQSVFEEQEDNVKPASEENAFNICFGNMNFTMNESMYVKL
ncbi:cytokine receptor-like factor 2 [Leptodactylus fuscus]